MKNKLRIFKVVPYDEVNDIYILKEKVFWIFYKALSAGSKIELNGFAKKFGILK